MSFLISIFFFLGVIYDLTVFFVLESTLRSASQDRKVLVWDFASDMDTRAFD